MAQHPGTDTDTAGTPPHRAAPHVHRDSSVQDFLDRMGRALTAGDGKTIATMWGIPALVIGDAMVMAVTTAAEVEQFFGGAKDQYNERGITDTRAEILRLEWVTDRIVVVDVRWPYLDAQGREVGAESSTYTLRRDDRGKLELRVALMRGVAEPG
jgi:hypothetical protein